MLKVVKLLHILILIDYMYSLHRDLQRVGLLNEFSCEAKCLCQMDFYIAMFICARGRAVAYSRIPQQQKRKNKQQTFVLYMPLLILNISFYLKYSLFYEKKVSLCISQFFISGISWQSCCFGNLQIVPGHQLNLSGVKAICRCSVFRGYLQMQCFQPLCAFYQLVFVSVL